MEKHAGGRPTDFTPELGEEICAWIASGKSLSKWCTPENRPEKYSVLRWLRRNEPLFAEFRAQYTLAREDQQDILADETIDIADAPVPVDDHGRGDNATVQAMKLRVETRRWSASVMAPKKYAPITKREISGPDGGAIEHVHVLELPKDTLMKIAAQGKIIDSGEIQGVAPEDHAGTSGAGTAPAPSGV